MRKMKILSLAAGVLLLSLAVHADANSVKKSKSTEKTAAPNALAQQIAVLISTPAVDHVHWGISVTTMEGKSIYALNDTQYFQPASNTKMITTAAALALIGPEYRSQTVLTETGTRTADGVLHGALRLVGTGDPSLNNLSWPYVAPVPGESNHFDQMPEAFNELARAAAKSGLTAVDGPVIADDSYFPSEPYPHGWSWDDLPYYFAVPVDALNINDNVVYLTLVGGAKTGDAVQAAWMLPMPEYELDMKGLTTIGAEEHSDVNVDHLAGTAAMRVYGGVPARKTQHIPIAVDDPAKFAARLMWTALEANGIKVSGGTQVVHHACEDMDDFEKMAKAPLVLHSQAEAIAALVPTLTAGEHVVATHTGPALWEDVQYTDKVSQNQHAEILLHLLGRAYGKDGSGAEGVRVERQFLAAAGVNLEDVVLYDGSGLSNNDMVTPRALTKLLKYAMEQSWGEQFHAALGIGGVDGTLKGRFAKPPLKGNVIAKTGTLSEVHALSGYLTCASGRTVIFSIMADMHDPTTVADREAMDAIVAAVYAAN